ncbi:putative T7SS-secreted protein [Streptomyces sp. NPDC054844]
MEPSRFPHLGFDPAPGDAEAVRLLVAAVGSVISGGSDAQTKLSRVGTSDGVWAGKSAVAFTDSVSVIPPYLKKSLNSMDAAHQALSSWETSLSDFQTRARKLEREAAEAASRVGAAKGKLDGLPSDTSGMSDKEKDEHDKDKEGRQHTYDTANDELDAVRSRAHTLNAEFIAAADDVSRRIKEAADDAPPEPGWFDELVDGLGEFFADAWETITDPNFWKLVGDLLADLAMVIGILALLGVPGLGWLGLIVAGGALGSHLIAWGNGVEGVSWKTLAWDAAGLFAGVRAFKGLKLGKAGSKLTQAGKALKDLGRANVRSGEALRLGQGFAASVGKAGRNIFKQSPWKNIKGIGDGVRNSLHGFRQMNTGLRQIAQGERRIAAGQEMVARGKTLDTNWTLAGVGLAGGSNANEDRWLDGKLKGADLPVVGTFPPLLEYDYGHESSPSKALNSASGSFVAGLAGAPA